MAVVDNLEIQIQANADQATANINKLAAAMRNFQKASGASSAGMQSANNAIKNVADQANAAASGVSGAPRIGFYGEALDAANEVEQLNSALSETQTMGEAAAEGLSETGTSAGETAKQSSTAAKEVKKLGDETKKAGKSAGSASKGGLSNFVSSLKRIAFYRFIRSIIKGITDGLKEGISNLYQWSKAQKEAGAAQFAQSMDKAATAAQYLKNSIAAAASPLMNALAPALDFVVDKLVSFINLINQMFAAFSGKTTWTRAIKAPKEYATAASGAAKAQQKWLAGFDELNNITTNEGGGGGGGTNFGDMFEEVPIDSGLLDWFDKLGLADKFKELQSAFQKLKDSGVLEFFEKLLFESTVYAFVNALDLLIDNLNLLTDILSGDFWGALNDIKNILVDITLGPIVPILSVFDSIFGTNLAGGLQDFIEWLRNIDLEREFLILKSKIELWWWWNVTKPLDDAFGGMVDGIKQAWDDFVTWLEGLSIVQAIKNLFGEDSKFSTLGDDLFGEDSELMKTINGIGEKFQPLVDAWNNLVEGVKTAWDAIVNYWNTNIQPVLDDIIAWIKQAIEDIDQWLQDSGVYDWLKGAIDWIGGAIESIFNILAAWAANPFVATIDATIDSINILASLLSGDLYGALEGLKDLIVDLVFNAIEPWLQTFDALFGTDVAGWWKDTQKSLKEFDLGAWAKQAVEDVKGFFKGLPDWIDKNIVAPLAFDWWSLKENIGGAVDDIKQAIEDAFKNALQAVKDVWFTIKIWWENNVSKPIREKVNNIKTNISNAFNRAKTLATTPWSTIGAWFYNHTVKPIKDRFEEVKKNAKEKFDGAWNNVKSAFIGAGTWFYNNFYVPINDKFIKIKSAIWTNMNAAWESVKKIFAPVGTFFNGIWNTIKDIFGKIGTSIGNAVASAFKTVVNSVLSWVESTVNTIINRINAVLDVAKNFGYKGGHLSNIYLPRLYASGGYPDVGEIFISREAGPELVGRIGSRTAVANNEQIIEGVANGVYNAIVNTGLVGMVGSIDRKSGNGGAIFAPSVAAGRWVSRSLAMYQTAGGTV